MTLASTTIAQLRAGALIGRKYALQNGHIFQPYAKLYAAQQMTSGGCVTMVGQDWNPAIKGTRVETGIGANWIPAEGVQLYLDYEFAKAKDYTKPYGLSAGARYAW